MARVGTDDDLGRGQMWPRRGAPRARVRRLTRPPKSAHRPQRLSRV